MRGELFDSTIPFGEPELLRASAYRRYLEELEADTTSGMSTRLAQLSPSEQGRILGETAVEAYGLPPG